jgi:hypothetical protein
MSKKLTIAIDSNQPFLINFYRSKQDKRYVSRQLQSEEVKLGIYSSEAEV